MSTTTSNSALGRRKPKSPSLVGNQPTITLASETAGLARGVSLAACDDGQWTRWRRYLARRKQPVSLAHLTRSQGIAALQWGMSAETDDGETQELLAQLQRRLLADKLLEQDLAVVAAAWLKEAPSRKATAALGVEALAWCHALPVLAVEFSPSLWCQVVAQLVQIAQDATAIGNDQSPLAQQLLAGELPLALAWQFPEIAPCAPPAKAARTALSDGVMDLLDEGIARGKHLPLAAGMLACWTRAVLMGEALEKATFRSAAQDQFRDFVRSTITFARPDGGAMLSPLGEKTSTELIDSALAVIDDAPAIATAEALCKSAAPPQNGKRRLLLPTALHSEWSETAVLRAQWSKNSPALAINYSGGQLACELISQQRVVWSGRCEPQLRIDGQPAASVERWEEVCWFTDDDVHYIELEAELGGGWKTQRQFLLARNDAILFIADAIIGPAAAQLEYRCDWPTAPAAQFQPAAETCEGTLHVGGRPLANLLPLALPEWRSEGRRIGALEACEAGVCYRVARRGERLYVPLVVDLEPWRIKRELTWRQLTVGHNLVPQSPEVAVGYRVQLYKQQWLIYRSLAERASRTVLGQNIYSEFVCARFNRGGDADTMIEIE